ncbi:hypothetical protein EG68_09400 [Paragonimus skrjabini miyazakii]|uniref:DUF4201 domain-containing protein n=1 Tax=Paragonimus skrjabini miyazakii TaxID=59628 RepID=A0A8S9YQR3_9TREM|nr:hypothetical protein EG68_09400 [Paragonimus skrjabini miyazakii]
MSHYNINVPSFATFEVDDISAKLLERYIERRKTSTHTLNLENEILSQYLRKLWAKGLLKYSDSLINLDTKDTIVQGCSPKVTRVDNQRYVQLDSSTKCAVARKEMRLYEKLITEAVAQNSFILEDYEFQILDCSNRIRDIEKTRAAFQRLIGEKSMNITAENLMRYFRNHLKHRDACYQKFKLENHALETRIRQVHDRLRSHTFYEQEPTWLDCVVLEHNNLQATIQLAAKKKEVRKWNRKLFVTNAHLQYLKELLRHEFDQVLVIQTMDKRRNMFFNKINKICEEYNEECKDKRVQNKTLEQRNSMFRRPTISQLVEIFKKNNQLTHALQQTRHMNITRSNMKICEQAWRHSRFCQKRLNTKLEEKTGVKESTGVFCNEEKASNIVSVTDK